MEDNFKNKFGFIFFIVFVLALAIGGYFFMNYTLNNKSKENNNVKENHKIDKKQEYIYYINDSTISEEAEIFYRDVVINLDTQEVLTKTLKEENEIYKRNIKYIDDSVMPDVINYNNDNLQSLNFRDYKNYEYNNYVSLLIIDYYYTCYDFITFYKTKSYIFNTDNGKLLTEDEILAMYDTDMDKIKDSIRELLEKEQKTVDDNPLIKIDDTINELNNYAFYINDFGRLYINFLVKTNQVDYNLEMEVK